METYVLIIMLTAGPLTLPGYHTREECEKTFAAIEQVLAFEAGAGVVVGTRHRHRCVSASEASHT